MTNGELAGAVQFVLRPGDRLPGGSRTLVGRDQVPTGRENIEPPGRRDEDPCSTLTFTVERPR